MTPIQQLMLGVGASKKTYIDDVYSTFLYDGTGSAQSINNGINLSGKGGLVWVKKRNNSGYSHVMDTSRGAGKSIHTDQSDAESDTSTALTAFNSNGFSIGAHGGVNQSGYKISSFSFRKAPGFFDIVTYTGNGSNRTIAHSLGCKPGMIIVKRTDGADYWNVLHRSLGIDKRLYLDNNGSATANSSAWWNATEPTSSVFSVGTDSGVNENNGEYVAYLFAGGESTNTLARSVEFDQSTAADRLTWSATSDFAFGTGDMTVEFWYKQNSATQDHARLCHFGPYWNNNDAVALSLDGANSSGSPGTIKFNSVKEGEILSTAAGEYADLGQWHHVAVTRSSGVFRLFVDGTLKDTNSSKTSADLIDSSTNSLAIAGTVDRMVTECFDGSISNFRVVKGTAVYTSSFKPPTEPLTNITNTKLLCCNNSSVTGSTVTPGTISSSGGDARTDSPFDDPAAFKFGENGDQGIIKCGSYTGGWAGMEVNVGFEPQWLLIKSASNTRSWQLVDCMRGFTAKGLNDEFISVDSSNAAADDNRVWPTPTGFGLDATDSAYNWTGSTYVYMAIRRPDGYVGKPADAGTDVFGMSTGTADSSIPLFSGSFPVDFSLHRAWASSSTWYAGARLMQGKYLRADTTDAEATHAPINYAFNAGWNNQDVDASASQSWQWKRHAGFDVVTYEGDGVVGRAIPHSLSKTPEMLWLKHRGSSSYNWMVYHKGLNGGTSPEDYYLRLNTNDAEASSSTYLNSTAPTSTHITLGSNNAINANGDDYIAMLFASVDGISKVGYYDGSSSAQTITTGFQPRFVILKRVSATSNWHVLDTTRGWGSGEDEYLALESNAAQGQHDFGAPTSTGFTLTTTVEYNGAGGKYIYYAHA